VFLQPPISIFDATELQNTKAGVAFGSMMCIPNFLKIHQLVQKLLGEDRHMSMMVAA
jgi:hypothetical protein